MRVMKLRRDWMQFNNRPNESFELKDGSMIWKNRSIAVIGHIYCRPGDGDVHVLMVKRGRGCLDNIGKWCLPCGYLDWDENAAEGITREIWEETGLNIHKAVNESQRIIYNGIKKGQPWKVMSDPNGDARQNVCLHFAVMFRSLKFPELEEATGGEENEVEEIKWINIDDLESFDIAFNHKDRIHDFGNYMVWEW